MEVVSEETRQKYYNQALQFAFSYFINGEYAIRKAYFSDTFNKSLLDELTKLKKNFIEIFGIDNSPFVLQSFIDYSLFFEYPDESSPFSSFFFKRYTKKINSLSIESKDIEKIYRIYKNDKSNFIKKLVSFTLISGIYPSDLLFPFEKNILDLPITPENFIRYSFQHVPHTSNILGYNNYIKFIDNSDNFNSIYQDKNPEYKFLLNFEANNFDINEVIAFPT